MSSPAVARRQSESGESPEARASAEAASMLLGAAVCEVGLAQRVAELPAEMFGDPSHRRIHAAMVELAVVGFDLTCEAIQSWLSRRGRWRDVAALDLAHVAVLLDFLSYRTREGMPRTAAAQPLKEWVVPYFDAALERLRCFEGVIWA